MALKIWLPLDGDLRNLGCSNIEVANNGATIDNAGKIGKCYYFDGNGHYLQLSESVGDLYSGDFSWAVWLKPTDSTRSIISSEYSSTGSSNVAFELSASRGVRIYWNGSPDIYPANSTLPINTWTHVAITKTTGTIKTYLNGQLTSTYTGTLSNRSSTSKIRIGDDYRGRTSVSYMGYMNDWRLYDHCLSAAEVHEIAQGLVLHYKLDGEVTTAKNLIKNGYGELGTTNWSNSVNFSSEVPPNHPEIKKSIYSNITIEYIPIESTHNYKLEAYLKNSATSGYTYPSLYPYDIDKNFISNYQCSAGFNLTTMTTLKQELKSGDTKIYVHDLSKWNANSGHYYNYAAIFSYSDSTGYIYPDGTYTRITPAFGSGTNAKTNLDKTNNIITLNTAYSGPTKPAGTAVCAATNGNTYYYPFGGLEKSSLNDWAYQTATIIPNNITRLKYAKYIHYATYDGTLHAGIKLIDLADDIDSTIISDSSGYGHNGTINGALTTSSDTAKYTISSYFGEYNTPNVILNNPTSLLPALTNCTITWWGKYDTTRTLLLTGQTNSYYIAASDNNNYYHGGINSSSPTMYKDGVAGTYKCAADGWHFFCVKNVNLSSWTALKINSYSSYWYLKGLISDFRIYCTPLLDNDIKMLYNVGMKVDNLQNLHTFEYKEDTSNLFRSELIMPWAKTNRTRIGEIVSHNDTYALNIAPEPFYKNISDSISGALDGMFIQNTSYIFDMWIDTDSVISNNNNGQGGMVIRYSDNSTDSTFVFLGGNKGYQHKVLITPSNKTIQRLEFYYYTSTDVFYRIDSCICPLSNLKLHKTGIFEGTNLLEETNTKLIKNALIETNQLIEI